MVFNFIGRKGNGGVKNTKHPDFTVEVLLLFYLNLYIKKRI